MLQRVLGVSGEELVGTLTNMVTFTRGEQIKRHYTKAMAEGKISFFLNLSALQEEVDSGCIQYDLVWGNYDFTSLYATC